MLKYSWICTYESLGYDSLLVWDKKTRIPAVARMGRTACIRMLAPNFRSRKGSDFPEWLQSHTRYGDAAISNARIKIRIRYSNSANVSDGCKQQHCIQNCSQTASDRNMVAFDSLQDVVTVLSNGTIADPYRVPFSYNTCITYRQTTDRRHIVPKARPRC